MKSLFTVVLWFVCANLGAQTERFTPGPGETANLFKPVSLTTPRDLTASISPAKPAVLAKPLNPEKPVSSGSNYNLIKPVNTGSSLNLIKPVSLIRPGSLNRLYRIGLPVSAPAFVNSAESDRHRPKFRVLNWRNTAVTAGLMMISGFADGTSETLKIKYPSFEQVFPGEDYQFWNYNISWTNKYKNGVPPTPAFPGAKSAFVWMTDGYHMMRMIRNSTMIVALVVHIGNGTHQEFRYFLLEALIHYLAYTGGFNLAYDVVFR